MAKITITLEDCRDDSGAPTVAVDMTGVSRSLTGKSRPTPAVRMSYALFDLAASEKMMGAIPACRWQPSNNSRH